MNLYHSDFAKVGHMKSPSDCQLHCLVVRPELFDGIVSGDDKS